MSSGPRHRARELALQLLFQQEARPHDWRPALAYLLEQEPDRAVDRGLVEALVGGTLAHLEEIDLSLGAASSWSLDQMGQLERTVLRLATEELCWERGTPVAVVIDEAVGLAKELAGEDSGRFVNGVLGQIARRRQGASEAAGARPPGR